MTQKPLLRAEVYARALRASQNRKEDSVLRAGSIILPPPSNVETVHEIILKPDLSPKKSDWTEHLMLEAKNAHLLFSCASAIKLRSIRLRLY